MIKKVLIIGANSFIGKSLIESLLKEKQIKLYATFRNKIYKKFKGVSYIRLDLSDCKNITKILQEDFDIIFYFASTTNVKKSVDNVFMDNQNVINILNILETIKYKKNKIIYASSGGTVYGRTQGEVLSENYPMMPICPYGITKVSIEYYLNFYKLKYGLNYCVLRYSNPYGKYQNPHSGTGAPSIFMYKALKHQPIDIYGKPEDIIRDYIYIQDLIEITKIVAFSNSKHDIYNIGYGEGNSLNDIIYSIEDIIGEKIYVNYKEHKEESVKKIVLDIRRIQEEFEWKPKISLIDGLKLDKLWIEQFIELENNIKS